MNWCRRRLRGLPILLYAKALTLNGRFERGIFVTFDARFSNNMQAVYKCIFCLESDPLAFIARVKTGHGSVQNSGMSTGSNWIQGPTFWEYRAVFSWHTELIEKEFSTLSLRHNSWGFQHADPKEPCLPKSRVFLPKRSNVRELREIVLLPIQTYRKASSTNVVVSWRWPCSFVGYGTCSCIGRQGSFNLRRNLKNSKVLNGAVKTTKTVLFKIFSIL